MLEVFQLKTILRRYCSWLCRYDLLMFVWHDGSQENLATSERATKAEKHLQHLKMVSGLCSCLSSSLLGIRFGIFTPTEAAICCSSVCNLHLNVCL
ncbi:hypothetical protein OH492_11645 [Vibrio chagasii]|nr:hypothetical protein [Vibrio chagasii]